MSMLRILIVVLAAVVGVAVPMSTAHADPIKCTDAKGVLFGRYVHETSSELTIECNNVPSGWRHEEPSWVTFQGFTLQNNGDYKATFKVQANPNVFPRYGNIKLSHPPIDDDFYRPVVQGGALAITDSAEYHSHIALNSLASAFGGHMGNTQVVTTLPLPTELGGTSVVLAGGPAGGERRLGLLYVSDTQINFHVPADIPVSGGSTYYLGVINTNGSTNVSVKEVSIESLAPRLFHAGCDPQTGFCAPSMYILRIHEDGTRSTEFPQLDEHGLQRPIDVSNPKETVFFILYGTGMHNADPAQSRADFVGTQISLPIQAIAAPQGFVGLQQINLQIPSFMAGKGLIGLRLSVHGLHPDTVHVNFK